MKCPICGEEMTDLGPDKLDQSGDTYLPARRWSCPKQPVEVIVPTSMQWESYLNPKREA